MDIAKWSRDRMEKTARETGPLGLSDFVRHALELECRRRPSAEEAARRIAGRVENEIRLATAGELFSQHVDPIAHVHYYAWIRHRLADPPATAGQYKIGSLYDLCIRIRMKDGEILHGTPPQSWSTPVRKDER